VLKYGKARRKKVKFASGFIKQKSEFTVILKISFKLFVPVPNKKKETFLLFYQNSQASNCHFFLIWGRRMKSGDLPKDIQSR